MKFLKILVLFFIFYSNSAYAAELHKVSLQLLWKHQFEFAGFYIAKHKGFYKDAGLEVEIKEYNFDTNIVKDVESGISTFGISYPSIILEKSNYNAKVVLLNALLQNSPHVLVSLKSSGIKSIKDFKNKKIKLLDSEIQSASISSMLYSNNIKYDDLIKVKYQYDINDLINKKVDIVAAFLSNELFILDNKNIKYDIWNPKDYGFDFYDDILFTSSKMIQENPDIVNKFQEASLKGWEYAYNHIYETVNLIMKYYNSQNKSKEALLYEARKLKKLAYVKGIPFGNIDKNKIQRIYDIYNLIGITKNKIDLDEFIYHADKNKIYLTLEEKKYLKSKKVINMCIDPNWMPFEKFDESGKHIGISADYFKLFRKQLNIDINVIQTKTWEETLEFAKQRKCDILSLAMATKDREKYLKFTKSYLKIPLVITTRKDIPFINDMRSLQNKRVGITKGYALVKILRKRYPNLIIVEVDNIEDGLKRVDKGELFGYIGTLASVAYQFQKGYTTELKVSGKFDEDWELGIAVRDDEPYLYSIFNKLINNLDTKIQQKILNDWISIKYEEGTNYTLIWNIAIVVLIIILLFIYRQYILYKANKKLKKIVDQKTRDLQLLNANLKIKVQQEVQKNFKIQEQLFQSEKMAAMGEMIGNISHQWRQPLSIISSASTGLKLRKQIGNLSDKDEYQALDSINEAAQYLSKTIDDFRNFLRPNKEVVEFNIKQVYQKALSLVNSKLKNENITCIENLEDIQIIGLENELIQVFINLMNNSIDAFCLNNIEERYLFVDIYKKDKHIYFEIKDSANGIGDDILNKIFEPYFTTKHKSQGTGIGLYMAKEIIENHMNGKIVAKNCEYEYKGKKYKGAKFIICLNEK